MIKRKIMKSFNEWLWSRNKQQKAQQPVPDQPNQISPQKLQDAILSKQAKVSGEENEWKCPNCEKPLSKEELEKSVCTGCWNKFMPHPLTYYGLGNEIEKKPYSSTVPMGSRTWRKNTDFDYHPLERDFGPTTAQNI